MPMRNVELVTQKRAVLDDVEDVAVLLWSARSDVAGDVSAITVPGTGAPTSPRTSATSHSEPEGP